MARPNSIPPKYYDEVVQLSADGLSAEKIVDYLFATHTIQVNINSVYRVLRAKKKERQEATQKIYAEAAAEHAYKDLDIIDAVIDRLNKEYKLSFDSGNKKEAKDLLDTLIKFQSKRMELSGLGRETADTEDLIDEAKLDLMKRLSN